MKYVIAGPALRFNDVHAACMPACMLCNTSHERTYIRGGFDPYRPHTVTQRDSPPLDSLPLLWVNKQKMCIVHNRLVWVEVDAGRAVSAPSIDLLRLITEYNQWHRELIGFQSHRTAQKLQV